MDVTKKKLACASLMSLVALTGLMGGCSSSSDSIVPASPTTTFVYTSDTHYGIKKVPFSGMSSAQQVNGAMIAEMNRIQTANIALPNDNGVNAGQQLGGVDFVAVTGDAVNRSEGAIYPYKNAPAAAMWPQFQADYYNVLNLKDRSGIKAPLFMTTGNHDTSNAVGYYKSGSVLDATAYANIYNLMMKPSTAMTNTSFIGGTPDAATAAASYATPGNRIVTSRDVNGVHFVFVGMWPDSVSRPLIDADLNNVPSTTPVVLFTHAPPVAESKLFTNPVAPNTINTTNKFENLISDKFAESTPYGTPYSDATGSTAIPDNIEQRALVTWLKNHKNIVAYFHGHDNANEFYTYTGPDNDISLPTFRVDSPMKGNVSVGDPTKLSFQVVSIDSASKNLTVREYLWNTKSWGASKTISLAPRVDPPGATVSFRFAVTDDSRASGGGALTPVNSAGFGNGNLVQNNGVSTLVMKTIANDILAQNTAQKIDFLLFPGDMITGEDQDPTHLSSMMDTWLTTMKSVTDAGIPIYTVRGNHEYSSTSALGAVNPLDPSLSTYKTHFPLTASLLTPVGTENGLTYSFTWKNAKFVAFDQYAGRTATFDNTKYAPGSNKGQMMNSWVLDQVNNSTAGVNFVMAHEQMWPSTSHSDCLANDPDSRDALVHALGTHNGTYLAGHDHMFVRGTMINGSDKVPAFVVGTGGGGNYNYSSFDVVSKGYTGASRYDMQKAISSSTNPTFGYMLVTVYSDNTWSAEFRGFNFNSWNSATDITLTPFTVMDSFRNKDILY